MTNMNSPMAPAILGTDGRPLHGEELPPPNTKRWVIRRKAAVVSAVRSGMLTMEEACERYNLSHEELLSWQQLIEDHGVRGLRTTRLQQYRSSGLREKGR